MKDKTGTIKDKPYGKESRLLLFAGILGCCLYVIGDYLYAATGRGQTTETIGLFVKAAYLEMADWRMWLSILCGFLGTFLYYLGFHRMHGLLKARVTDPKNQIWVRLFRVSYLTGTVSWAWVHAMFMTNALTFKYIFEAYGDRETAADIANRVLYANAPGMIAAYVLCDIGLAVIMLNLIWRKVIPLPGTGARILASLCNPIALPGIFGNLMALLPWPLNQLDHGTESFGHALVLILGLVLLRDMEAGKEAETEAGT